MLAFIHIGKTGGSYLKARLRQASLDGPTTIRTPRGHSLTLPKAITQYPDAGIIFAIREPYARYVSAFNSRQRKGQPRLYVEHSAAEAVAFARFGSPDELAVALGSLRPSVRREAQEAMQAIYHLRRSYSWYLKDVATLTRNADRVSFIFQTETLDDDLRDFGRRLGIPVEVPEAVSDLERHATPGGQPTELSARGRRALKAFWRDELLLYAAASELREEIRTGPPRLRGLDRGSPEAQT